MHAPWDFLLPIMTSSSCLVMVKQLSRNWSPVLVCQAWGITLCWWCSVIQNVSLFKQMQKPGRLWTLCSVHLSILVGIDLVQIVTFDREYRQSNMARTIMHCLRFPKQLSGSCFKKPIFFPVFSKKNMDQKIYSVLVLQN